MINSILCGKELNSNNIHTIYDVDGNHLDLVSYFESSLNEFMEELTKISNIWSDTTLDKKKEILRNIKKIFENENFSYELTNIIEKEIGKPKIEAETEISESISLIDYFLDNLKEDYFIRKISIDSYYKTKQNFLQLRPFGIVAIIKPWNYPITNSLWSIIPALLAGNVIIYKPSEYCCKCASLLSYAIINSGLPTGVFNVIYGGSNVGEKIVDCKKVSMISFTGGSEAAHEIQKRSAKQEITRKFSIESGGSDFAIIDKNVNLEFAADGIIWGAYNNSGQVCTSVENVLAPVEYKETFLKLLIERVNLLQAGIDYGKIQNKKLLDKINKYLSFINSNHKSEIIIGGKIINGYLKPTIIECKDIEFAKTEIFSNIFRIFWYNDEKDIPTLVNNSCYGLGCTIWTSHPNSDRITKLIDKLDVGMIWVNDVNIAFPECPWTGIKDSGIGYNLGLDSVLEFSHLKTISIDSEIKLKKEWWFPYGNV